jgi:hypothetical protein
LLAIALLLTVLACESPFDNQNSSLPLAGPKSVQVMGKNEALFAQWTRVASAQGVVPHYEVYYSTSANPETAAKLPAPVYSGDMNLVTAEIPGLMNYTPYYVWVKAVFPEMGVSGYSPTETGIPIPPPDAPPASALPPANRGWNWRGVPDKTRFSMKCTMRQAEPVPANRLRARR